MAELFEQNLAKASRKRPEDSQGGPRIVTTRREALHLYREIMRYSNLFVWRDEKGVMWRDVLRSNARKEYDDARFETDPEIINKVDGGGSWIVRLIESIMSCGREDVGLALGSLSFQMHIRGGLLRLIYKTAESKR